MRWTTLQKEKSHIVLEFTNNFHTLCTNMGIKYSEQHLVLKYRGAMHRYIQTEMYFLNISPLGVSYRYAIKIEQKFRHKKKWEFGSANMKQPKHCKDEPNQHPLHNHSKTQDKKGKLKMKNDTGKWCDFHKIP
jgi:hypothetical protein